MTRTRLALTMCLALAACAREQEGGAWVRAVAEAHAEIEGAPTREARASAMDGLDALVEADPPPDIARSDARNIRQDAYYVLASTALADGDPYAARRFATVGLSLGMRKDVLVTNLLVARGEAFEMLDQPASAATDYHRALSIASEMLDERLARMGGSTP
jgi:hypothetical protein